LASVACSLPQQGGKKNRMNAINFFQDTKAIALANAVERDDVNRIREVVREGGDVNVRGAKGMTLLVWAIGHEKKNALRALLELGANPNARDETGMPVLEIALEPGDIDYFRMLLSAGADPGTPAQDGEPLLFEAILAMNWPACRLLVEKGANINAADREGTTPVLSLAMLNQWEMVHWFVERGADPLKPNAVGGTVAWLLQESDLDPASPGRGWAERVKVQLEQRGVRFPVAKPQPPKQE
jgi:ankyrin repeat protein